MVDRVDVFSPKGGVGKTTLAVLLARREAKKRNKPVLLVDADLTGTCLGDLLHPHMAWHSQRGLSQLICAERPERLVDLLGPGQLPVYEHRPQGGEDTAPLLQKNVSGGVLLFCPSHAYATEPKKVRGPVLHALMGHESAGGWVQHVIDEVIAATQKVSGDLGAVVVDHGPGIGALQSALLEAIAKAEEKKSKRRALVVTSRDWVDLSATNQFETRHLKEFSEKDAKRHEALLVNIAKRVVWAVNRVESVPGKDWRQVVKQGLSEQVIQRVRPEQPERKEWSPWFEGASPVWRSQGLADGYARCELAETKELEEALANLQAKIFEG